VEKNLNSGARLISTAKQQIPQLGWKLHGPQKTVLATDDAYMSSAIVRVMCVTVTVVKWTVTAGEIVGAAEMSASINSSLMASIHHCHDNTASTSAAAASCGFTVQWQDRDDRVHQRLCNITAAELHQRVNVYEQRQRSDGFCQEHRCVARVIESCHNFSSVSEYVLHV